MLESITQSLQAIESDLLKVSNHVQEIINILVLHRENSVSIFEDILTTANNVADEINVELSIPRQAKKQTLRGNRPNDSINEYYRRSIFIPYVDSLISSLQSRFSDEHKEHLVYLNYIPNK
jgi:hypothetical protein